MPYKLRKAPKRDLYWVVTIETGKKHSKEPIALEKAKAQKRILERVLVGGITQIELRDLNAKYPPSVEGTHQQNARDTIRHYSEFRQLLNEHQMNILRLTKGEPDYRNYNLLEIFDFIIINLIKEVENRPNRLTSEENQNLINIYIRQILNRLGLIIPKYEQELPIAPLPRPSKVHPSKFAPTKRGAGRGVWSQLLRALQRYAGVEGQGVMDDVIRDEIDTLPAGDFEGKKKVVLRAIRRYFPPDELLADAVYWQVHLAKVKEDLNMALSILNNDIKYRNSRSNNGRMQMPNCSGVGCFGTTGIMSSFGMGKKRDAARKCKKCGLVRMVK